MNMIELIEKKRDGYELSKDEIDFIIKNYTVNLIPDYQMSAFCMAVYFNGMTDIESTYLANAIYNSGDHIDLSSIEGVKVDKHSTGGVGDKTSLVLAPLVASLGIKFAKMSGRGLGHTGGTLDKLESIKGYNISLSMEQFVEQVKRINIALIGQTGNLTPADKKLYALRDVTGTVPSIPLIASSIMGKKLASGANSICLDVKVGSGAFMKTEEDALKLAELMVKIGKNCGRNMTAILTNMDEPLGYAVGNSLEVIEAINTLMGKGPSDLLDLCLTIGSYLVVDANKADSLTSARQMLMNQISNGNALKKLAELVQAQGGDSNYIYNKELFARSKSVLKVVSERTGYVHKIDALKIGHSAMLLGAGRMKLDDTIDHSVGIVLNKKVGDFVNNGEVLAYVYANKDASDSIKLALDAFEIDNVKTTPKLIIKIVR